MYEALHNRITTAGLMTPASWGRSLSASPTVDRSVAGTIPLVVRHWRSIDPDIDQRALDHHLLSIHLGGAKRLRRSGEGVSETRDAACGAFSLVPSGAAFRWMTEGPVDFMHVYFDCKAVDRVVEQAFGRDPSSVTLRECLGEYDPLVHALGSALLEEMQDGLSHRVYLDDLIHLLLLQLFKVSSNLGGYAELGEYAIAPFRLKRATDFIEQNFRENIGVRQIAAAAGVSIYHFSRAFKLATGSPPYAFLLSRRVAHAKLLLSRTHQPLTMVAQACGFSTPSQFARAFRREAGLSPSRYRKEL